MIDTRLFYLLLGAGVETSPAGIQKPDGDYHAGQFVYIEQDGMVSGRLEFPQEQAAETQLLSDKKIYHG